jgi:hypothetical protein
MGQEGDFVCIVCGTIMYGRSCKLRCPKCGYFEDCSDGGNAQTNFVPKDEPKP